MKKAFFISMAFLFVAAALASSPARADVNSCVGIDPIPILETLRQEIIDAPVPSSLNPLARFIMRIKRNFLLGLDQAAQNAFEAENCDQAFQLVQFMRGLIPIGQWPEQAVKDGWIGYLDLLLDADCRNLLPPLPGSFYLGSPTGRYVPTETDLYIVTSYILGNPIDFGCGVVPNDPMVLDVNGNGIVDPPDLAETQYLNHCSINPHGYFGKVGNIAPLPTNPDNVNSSEQVPIGVSVATLDFFGDGGSPRSGVGVVYTILESTLAEGCVSLSGRDPSPDVNGDVVQNVAGLEAMGISEFGVSSVDMDVDAACLDAGWVLIKACVETDNPISEYYNEDYDQPEYLESCPQALSKQPEVICTDIAVSVNEPAVGLPPPLPGNFYLGSPTGGYTPTAADIDIIRSYVLATPVPFGQDNLVPDDDPKVLDVNGNGIIDPPDIAYAQYMSYCASRPVGYDGQVGSIDWLASNPVSLAWGEVAAIGADLRSDTYLASPRGGATPVFSIVSDETGCAHLVGLDPVPDPAGPHVQPAAGDRVMAVSQSDGIEGAAEVTLVIDPACQNTGDVVIGVMVPNDYPDGGHDWSELYNDAVYQDTCQMIDGKQVFDVPMITQTIRVTE